MKYSIQNFLPGVVFLLDQGIPDGIEVARPDILTLEYFLIAFQRDVDREEDHLSAQHCIRVGEGRNHNEVNRVENNQCKQSKEECVEDKEDFIPSCVLQRIVPGLDRRIFHGHILFPPYHSEFSEKRLEVVLAIISSTTLMTELNRPMAVAYAWSGTPVRPRLYT